MNGWARHDIGRLPMQNPSIHLHCAVRLATEELAGLLDSSVRVSGDKRMSLDMVSFDTDERKICGDLGIVTAVKVT